MNKRQGRGRERREKVRKRERGERERQTDRQTSFRNRSKKVNLSWIYNGLLHLGYTVQQCYILKWYKSTEKPRLKKSVLSDDNVTFVMKKIS
jgi:hypothetical protein